MAALVHDPKFIQPLRDAHRELAAQLAADGTSPGVAETVRLVINGLWFDWILGSMEMTPQRRNAVRATLERLIDERPAGAGRVASGGRARKKAGTRKRGGGAARRGRRS